MPSNGRRERFVSPAGLVLAGAYLGLSVSELRELAEKRGLPLLEIEYELYVLERQGNIEVRDGRLSIPPTAHRLTRQLAEKAARSIGVVSADNSI